MDRQQAKPLGRMNTDEVCQWFTRIGLEKCLPFIRGIGGILPPAFPRPDVAQQGRRFRLTAAATVCHLIRPCSLLSRRLKGRRLSHVDVCELAPFVHLTPSSPFPAVAPEAGLCGADVASVGPDLLRTLRVITVEDRERLLSAVYSELHPPTQLSQRLDALLGTLPPSRNAGGGRSRREPFVSVNVPPVCPQNPRIPATWRRSRRPWRR